MNRSDEQLYDVRLMSRFKERGLISKADINGYREKLNDVEEQAESITETVYADYVKREQNKADKEAREQESAEPAFTLAN